VQSMLATKIPASFVVADAALESGWGLSELTREAMNLFGVKADSSWHGETYPIRTREFLNGQWIMEEAEFRKYANWLDSLNDHAQFLITNLRYRYAFNYKTGALFATAVANAHYATDPNYAEKIIAIINAHGLAALDRGLAPVQAPAPAPIVIPATPLSPPVVVAPKAPAPAKAASGGLFGWLKKIF
jgi:flagellum-specific peptidoglycan hydrolase FlgJ